MARVRFNVNTEYAYIQNFKILQNLFTRHAIERTVPIESLTKCKMQDNLEFLQWTKRFWDANFPGHDYDAVARRKGAGVSAPTPAAPVSGRTSTTTSRKPAQPTPARATPRAAGAAAGGAAMGGATALALRQENETMKEAITGLEKERDFYFSKLRDIELLLQTAVEQDPELDKDDNGLIKQIQAILYSTEEGFEIPVEAEGEANGEEPDTF
ncbi:microtubule integrity protein mal3 [Lithohypha guttulata]|uniref:Microtubule integrity protein mal3 n=1 Tax=Lithohypha guttulata TaxID=1690604 RepID=A0ABR0KFX6_9EURO|nr:microtubule integrity protein mal3 [Lithohypha guttulata]